MKRINVYIIIAAVILFVQGVFAQPDLNLLNERIENAVKQYNIPGIAVGIVKDGEIVYHKTYGYRHIERKDPIDGATMFGIASMSKAFTAVCLGILVDEGKISWTDKVIEHLPEFQLHDPYATREMMVMDLLCHRSGLATFDGDKLWYGSSYNRKEILERIKYMPLKHSFRARYGYQNIMFIAAGELIERVSGQSWDQFVEDRIFRPLGMKNSNTTTSTFKVGGNYSTPHIDGKAFNWIDYDNSGPAASINSSMDDILIWLKMWLNKGEYNGTRILSEQQYRYITTAYTPVRTGTGDNRGETSFTGAGLGWFVMDYEGRKILQHSGGLPGVHTKTAFVPAEKLGFVILSNQIDGLVDPIMTQILDEYLKTEKKSNRIEEGIIRYRDYIKKDGEERLKREEKRVIGTKPAYELNRFAGRYEDRMYGEAEITEEKGALRITLLPTKELFTGVMEHWHFNTFRVKLNDPFLPAGFVTFELNPDGEVTGLKIDLPNPDFHFYNLNFLRKKS
jgi:CubicO group peptidase (beta-lactamase class C family)